MPVLFTKFNIQVANKPFAILTSSDDLSTSNRYASLEDHTFACPYKMLDNGWRQYWMTTNWQPLVYFVYILLIELFINLCELRHLERQRAILVVCTVLKLPQEFYTNVFILNVSASCWHWLGIKTSSRRKSTTGYFTRIGAWWWSFACFYDRGSERQINSAITNHG